MPKTTDTRANAPAFTFTFEDDVDTIALIHRLVALKAVALESIDQQITHCLVNARLEGRFDAAVAASGLSRTAALKLTRDWNRRGGSSIRWSDGLDPVNPSTFTG